MNLVTRLGMVTLTAITIAPLATAATPINAGAHAVAAKSSKTYKISKKVLKSHKQFMFSETIHAWGFGVTLSQRSAKTLRIIDARLDESGSQDYQITSQKVKGNKMTLKLKPSKVKGAHHSDGVVKGSGTIKLVRTGRNTYKAALYQSTSAITRINGRKSSLAQEGKFTPKKRTLKFKLVNKKYLLKHSTMVKAEYRQDYQF
ncbi:hypothetical protein D1831_03075 [Lactiplantibacillus garii]|uniref:Uncharacterized protein n=1 Tax=Lactiplantibacillus garii TaxID=2306423 RepID=A0A426D9G1_9LACO|nr:hypothetical protein [Lactiplantibacillus garii]RRK11221.1 hypothetical protein D1831_03075 [Lactiplantibacillus garii]